MTSLASFPDNINIAVIGASGGIGSAFVNILADDEKIKTLYAFSRSEKRFQHPKIISAPIDLNAEASIQSAASAIETPLNLLIIASGILHDDTLKPEKNLRDLNQEAFMRVFTVNTFGPALVAKHFLPLLAKDGKSVFAALSARVGSISDNDLGGWYAYRASKTALNMILKTASIEVARRYKEASIIGLHPNTVDTALSEPFQAGVNHEIFTPENAAAHMIGVIDTVTAKDTGKVFAWDGQEIPA